jgi:uncharacterized protein YlaI
MNSIIQKNKQCYVCGNTQSLECHHIFSGTANRKQSEKFGLKVFLCNSCHHKIQLNYEPGLELKQMAQKKAMDFYKWSIEDFRKIIGKNYLE